MLESKIVIVRFKKLHPDAKIPEYKHSGDSGMDVSSIEDVEIRPNELKPVSTGLAVQIPFGYEIQCRPRSGLLFKHNVFCHFGTIDSGFRGELKALLHNCGANTFLVNRGDRVMQWVLAKVETARMVEVDELSETDRNTSGYGSTGLK